MFQPRLHLLLPHLASRELRFFSTNFLIVLHMQWIPPAAFRYYMHEYLADRM